MLLPVLCLAGSAWAAARTLARLGAGGGLAVLFGSALVLATPLWGYAGSDYGEPLQALCVALSVLALVELRGVPASRRWQIALGLAAGFAILRRRSSSSSSRLSFSVRWSGEEEKEKRERRRKTGISWKGRRKGGRRVAAGRGRRAGPPRSARGARRAAMRGGDPFVPPWPLLLSFAGILFLWFFFEISRFGKLGGGYGGETFAYPVFMGLLRLTVLPNKGLLWYAPVTLLAVPGFLAASPPRRAARARARPRRSLALLFASSAWWAWDGQAGWGPRLVPPALPCLMALAGAACAAGGAGVARRGRRRGRWPAPA